MRTIIRRQPMALIAGVIIGVACVSMYIAYTANEMSVLLLLQSLLMLGFGLYLLKTGVNKGCKSEPDKIALKK